MNTSSVPAVRAIPATVSRADLAREIRDRLPPQGLFAGHAWRISPEPFPLGEELAEELAGLGRVLLQFNRAVNLLYRQSAAGKEPRWVADYLDQGKPPELVRLQRASGFKNDVPRVIRPDLLLTDTGLSLVELDSVPGGIGLTAWLNRTYAEVLPPGRKSSVRAGDNGRAKPRWLREATASLEGPVIGGADGMLEGFAGIFGDAPKVHIVISTEAATYEPEMQWLAQQLGTERFQVRRPEYREFDPGDAVYRFFELFDLRNVVNAAQIFDLAEQKRVALTPPPKAIFEEKLLFALLWNRNLRGFWRRELGEAFLQRLLNLVPYTWVVDPAPLPPHAAIPELNLTDWHQLKGLSQKERELVLKVSGFSAEAWGARGVYLGSDLSAVEWSAAVDKALTAFPHSPYVLQRFHKPRLVVAEYFDFAGQSMQRLQGRVRLCPYYFVTGEEDGARAALGGVLATICPADKKIIHGMADAILAPCVRGARRADAQRADARDS